MNFPIGFVYFIVKRHECSREEMKLYFKKLSCPHSGYLAFYWLFFHFPEYRSIVYHRHYYVKKLFSLFYKAQTNLQIDTVSKNLGTGLMIWHGFSTIINAQLIGENCTIWHHVTIGNKLDNSECKPIIGNNVKICTGSIIIGNIKIGDNVIVGAGSVVVKDIPNNCVVAGCPAKIIKYTLK